VTQVEPSWRRSRRDDESRSGESSGGYGSGRGARPDSGPQSPSRGSSRSGYDPRPGGRDARPGSYDARPGYDPRPGGSGTRDSRSAGYDPRPPRPNRYDPRPPAGPTGRPGQPPPTRRPNGPPSDENDRRGTHATLYGQGFSWVVLWTILGAILPGTGLIAAGWRRLGAAVLAVIGLTAALIAAWALSGDILKRSIAFAADAQKLLVLAVVAAVVGVLWAAIILLTNSQLRRYATLDMAQKAFSWVVVGALLIGVAVPTYAVGKNALAQRDLVNAVFDQDVDGDGAKPDSEAADPWAGTDRINVLLIGSDAGATRTGIRPDTLILASIQPSSGNTVLFSLPRNLQQVPFKAGSPGEQAWPDGYYCPDAAAGAECMLNAIWRWAEGDGAEYYSKYKNPGLRATEDAVSGTLGLEIDTYAMLNLDGFADFIDAIGGVRLNVYERLPIGGNSSHPVAKGWIEIGDNQLMDGYTALWFARSRWSTDDYDRMRRQRCVIAAVTEQADPVTVAKNWTKIAKALQSNMATGISTDDIEAWVELASRVQGGKVTSLAFTSDVVGGSTVDPDFDLIQEKVQKAIAKSEKAAAKAEASATATPTTDDGTTTTKKKKKSTATATTADASTEDAEDVDEVC